MFDIMPFTGSQLIHWKKVINWKLSNSVGVKVYTYGKPASERENTAAGRKESLKQTCSPLAFA